LSSNQTVSGAKSDKLLPAIRGHVVFEEGYGGLRAIRLPDLKETVLRDPEKAGTPEARIHSLSGPDSEGRVAYIEDYFFVDRDELRRHHLKIINVDGTNDTVIFTRPGDALWAGTTSSADIGDSLALSPVGGRVALLTKKTLVQMPGALLRVGKVEVWDINKRTPKLTSIEAIDDGLAWLPDGRRIAYATLVSPKKVVRVPDADAVVKTFKDWDKVPGVHIADINRETEWLVAPGWRPIVSADGRSVLISDSKGAYRLVDIETKKSRPIIWKGAARRPIAMPKEDVLLTYGIGFDYWLRMMFLEGTLPVQLTTLKMHPSDSETSQTIVTHVEAFKPVSFGTQK
jgi:hypothetical protein